jgi:hypothetical protein
MASYDSDPVGPDSPLLSPRNKYITPSLRQPVKIDPTASGTIIRYALVVEVGLNMFMGTALVAFPRWLLSLAMTEHSPLTPMSISICQWVGAITFAFSIQVALVIPNTRGAIESRRLVYWTLLAGECFLILLFLYQAFWATNGGLTPEFLVVTTFFFVDHMLWRLFCLFVKPNWFGRYQGWHND